MRFAPSLRLQCLILGAALGWAVPSTARAEDDSAHARHLAAEIAILAGDVRRLIQETLPPLERTGLEQRLAGGLASLPLALRRAGGDASVVPPLRTAAGRRAWPALRTQLNVLQRRHPFAAERLLGAAPTRNTLALGESIHRATCAGCHDTPATDDHLLPAKNLTVQAHSMPPEEFAARLWLGVRGNSSSALANPFSTEELAALIAWYRQPR